METFITRAIRPRRRQAFHAGNDYVADFDWFFYELIGPTSARAQV